MKNAPQAADFIYKSCPRMGIWVMMKGQVMEELDCEGLLCPLPVLRARKRLIGLAPGTVLAVRATDGMAAIDLPHFCAQAGHVFLGAEDQGGGVTRYLIRRGAESGIED